MRLAILCGLSDYKLSETLKPMQSANTIQSITLIRRKKIDIPGVQVCTPPQAFANVVVLGDLWRFMRIFMMCLCRRCDYLMGIHYKMHCVYVGICGVLFNIPYAMMIVEDPKKYKESTVFRYLIKRAHMITVRGQNSKRYLIEECGAVSERVHVLRDPLKLECMPSHDKQYDFVFVGNMVKEKRPDILIKVFESLKQRDCVFKAVVIGRGPLADDIRKMISEKSLNEQVDYLGYVDDVFDYMRVSKCFIMTSQTEGMPTVLLEAFQCGLPAIVPDVGDITDIVQDGVNGWVVPAGDVAGFADACKAILDNESVYNDLQQGVERYCLNNKQNYKQETIVRLWDDLFGEVTLS